MTKGNIGECVVCGAPTLNGICVVDGEVDGEFKTVDDRRLAAKFRRQFNEGSIPCSSASNSGVTPATS